MWNPFFVRNYDKGHTRNAHLFRQEHVEGIGLLEGSWVLTRWGGGTWRTGIQAG